MARSAGMPRPDLSKNPLKPFVSRPSRVRLVMILPFGTVQRGIKAILSYYRAA